ncbi:MAG: hypothetical protein ABSB42_01230 [Tepidisphaeraceae bacterium]|jgi:hypothetical protein
MTTAIETKRPEYPKHKTLPTRFTPRFWQDADRRVALVRAIEDRVRRMKDDTGSESYAKEILCERAIFIVSLLETSERDAIEGIRALDVGSYVQSCNALLGILKSLGLERQVKKLGSLAAYVEERRT